MRRVQIMIFVGTWWLAVTPEYSFCEAQSTNRKRRREKSSNGRRQHDEPRFDYEEFFSKKHDVMELYAGGPKHIWEGLLNTIVVSGSAAAIGLASVIGFPILALISMTPGTSHEDITTTDNSRVAARLARLMAGGLVGCVAAGASWAFAAVYGLWQTAVGLYRTPATLMAQMQRKCYYNYTDGKWQHYNLTNHFAILSEFGGGRSRGIRVQDDSFYKLLQVSTDASQKDIKRAYYKLAKEYHPDKMSTDDDKEAVNERFLKLHQAYETLHDPQQRQQYDEFGSSSIESVVFDSDVFFDVLFGFSPELELYIGDLAIKSFAADLLHVVVAAQIGSHAGSINQEQILNQLFSTFFLKSRDRRDTRQVEIALYLQDFIAPFVKGEIDMGSFSRRCAKEANNIAGSTSFPLFLKSIGKALYWQGRRTITSVVDLPTAAMAWTREGVVGLETWTWPPIAVARLIRQTNNHVARATEWLENQSQQRYSDEEWQALHFKKIIEGLLPSLMDFVWDYNGRDITDALDGACWKLLHTTTTLSARERKRQAQALQELGSSFINVAESWEYREPRTATNQDNDSGHSENDSRIKRAIEMAMQVRP